jgi:hypothetical protein
MTRNTITLICREQDRLAQRRMWRRMRRHGRLRAWAPIMLAACTLVALSFAGTVALVQAAAQL